MSILQATSEIMHQCIRSRLSGATVCQHPSFLSLAHRLTPTVVLHYQPLPPPFRFRSDAHPINVNSPSVTSRNCQKIQQKSQGPLYRQGRYVYITALELMTINSIQTSPSTATNLEVDGSTSLLLVSSQLEVLASLEGKLVLGLASGALETDDDFLGLQG